MRTSEGSIHIVNGRSAADRARHGDLDAFEELMHARIDSIFRLSYAIVGDEADARDATQETFIAAWRRIRELRDTDRFDAWLQRIAVNSARMTLRARGRRRVREIPSGDVSALATAAERVAPPVRADADLLGAALDVLPIDQRTILVLHHLEGHAVAELAEILAVPVGTVKSRLHTARRALQDALAAEGHVA
ncbi:MAG: RNA polymerase sigma factor [Chloroflexota bacterium]